MRTIISGPVDFAALDSAELIAGITPTSFVTNGLSEPPFTLLDTKVYPICTKLGAYGEDARDYTLCLNADALIVSGRNDHLVRIARQFGMPVFEA